MTANPMLAVNDDKKGIIIKIRFLYDGYTQVVMVKLSDLRACKQCHMIYFKTPSERCAHCSASTQQEEVKFD